MEIASMSLLSSSCRTSVYAVAFLFPLDSSAFSLAPIWDSSTSHTATTSTFGRLDQLLTWLPPRPPTPTTPIRTVSLGWFARPRTAAPLAMTAVLMMKCLRFMLVPGG
jgi:hypothetical protein